MYPFLYLTVQQSISCIVEKIEIIKIHHPSSCNKLTVCLLKLYLSIQSALQAIVM